MELIKKSKKTTRITVRLDDRDISKVFKITRLLNITPSQVLRNGLEKEYDARFKENDTN